MPRVSGNFAWGCFVWLPAALMVGIIVRESTEAFSSTHTALFLRPIWQAVFGNVSDERWAEMNHVLRKSGHFVGYGILGLAWLRAWLLHWMYSLRRQYAAVWRRWSWLMAICCTAVVASLDEIHQTFLPSRTGVWQDVVLDTLGAVALCGLATTFWIGRGKTPFVAVR